MSTEEISPAAINFKPTEKSLEKLNIVKMALKKPRGASIGLDYRPSFGSKSDGGISVLSMQLRQSKAAAIWTKDSSSVSGLAKEQSSAMGNFPGPCPVIYWGSLDDEDSNDVLSNVVQGGATAIVLDYNEEVDSSLVDSMGDVGVIWKVSSLDQMQKSSEKGMGDIFLLSDEFLKSIDPETAKESLSSLSKSIVTIAPLASMQPQNNELATGKQYASMGISSLLFESCCVGDDEDFKYAQFAVDGISKKASSSFSMTGLTGSTNGHFGTSSHGREVKWLRCS